MCSVDPACLSAAPGTLSAVVDIETVCSGFLKYQNQKEASQMMNWSCNVWHPEVSTF